jgi:hypothetical protein
LNVTDVGINTTEPVAPDTTTTVQFAGELALGPEMGDLSIISQYMTGKTYDETHLKLDGVVERLNFP